MSDLYNYFLEGEFILKSSSTMSSDPQSENEEVSFVEFRRKVRAADLQPWRGYCGISNLPAGSASWYRMDAY